MSIPVLAMRVFGCVCAAACVPWLAGCDRTHSSPERPLVPLVPAVTPPLPTMDTVVLPPIRAKEDPTPKATDGVRRPAQQSDDKPMPGQNNDHSAPLSPAK